MLHGWQKIGSGIHEEYKGGGGIFTGDTEEEVEVPKVCDRLGGGVNVRKLPGP